MISTCVKDIKFTGLRTKGSDRELKHAQKKSPQEEKTYRHG